MSVSLPQPSNRLLRAAAAEQADLVRHRARLSGERGRLLEELRALEDALIATDRRLDMLAQLVGTPPARDHAPDAGHESASEHVHQAAREHEPAHAAAGRSVNPPLRGPAIREAAVRVLLAQPEQIEAVHYRRWYELLTEAGHRVAGKDPLAVFLTQLGRSPVVRKASAPGVYELDRHAPARLRDRMDRLQGELREVTVAPPGPIELAAVRARRHELDLAISQLERSLEEALRVLGLPADASVTARHALTPTDQRNDSPGNSGACRPVIQSSTLAPTSASNPSWRRPPDPL